MGKAAVVSEHDVDDEKSRIRPGHAPVSPSFDALIK